MIDYIALTIGHALLALALWRLAVRECVDHDPLLGGIREAEEANRKAAKEAGRSPR